MTFQLCLLPLCHAKPFYNYATPVFCVYKNAIYSYSLNKIFYCQVISCLSSVSWCIGYSATTRLIQNSCSPFCSVATTSIFNTLCACVWVGAWVCVGGCECVECALEVCGSEGKTHSYTKSLLHEPLNLILSLLQAKLIIRAAYGSQRHLAGFRELGLQPDQVYIHGNRRSSKNLTSPNCQASACMPVCAWVCEICTLQFWLLLCYCAAVRC